jgi:hypothetical protein
MRQVVPKKTSAYLEDPRILLGLYLLAALVVALQKMALGGLEVGGRLYPPYQNYVAFRNAFFHLIARQDLYAAFPLEQADLFKYTPTFALAMAPIAALPYTLGAVAWNMVNAATLFGAVWWLPFADARRRAWILWFVFLSLVSSMQTAQSNGVMAGLMLGAFAARERGRPVLSAFLGVAATFAKPFGLFALVACLTQPGRRRFLAWAALWALILLAAPLVVVPPAHLAFLYRSWGSLLLNDHATKAGLSVMSWLDAWFGLAAPKNLVLALGTLILILPLTRGGWVGEAEGRTLFAASVLVYVVIFNHMAESPTYVIAILGVALWYFSRRPTPLDTALLAATFALSCLAATDLVPQSVRSRVVEPLVLKTAPCIAVWLKLQYDMLARPAATVHQR